MKFEQEGNSFNLFKKGGEVEKFEQDLGEPDVTAKTLDLHNKGFMEVDGGGVGAEAGVLGGDGGRISQGFMAVGGDYKKFDQELGEPGFKKVEQEPGDKGVSCGLAAGGGGGGAGGGGDVSSPDGCSSSFDVGGGGGGTKNKKVKREGGMERGGGFAGSDFTERDFYAIVKVLTEHGSTEQEAWANLLDPWRPAGMGERYLQLLHKRTKRGS